MPVVSILIPFRATDDHRQKLLDCVVGRLNCHFPDAEVIVASDDGLEPFSKNIAVNNAAKLATSDILVMLDGDVWLDPDIIMRAAEEIRKGSAPWVRPCNKVKRINESFTETILALPYDAPFPVLKDTDLDRVTKSIGLCFVFSKESFLKVGGMDPRFRGWGWEDNAWITMLDGIIGKHKIYNNSIDHLWHPRERDENNKPVWPGQTDRNNKVGSLYNKAKGNKKLLKKIVDEVSKLNNFL